MDAIVGAITAEDVSGIVVSGAAGVGKSRIAREALETAMSLGCEVRWAVCTSAAREIPLGAFTAWAPSGVTDTVQLVRGLIESLTAVPAETRVVIGIDDVHLLDDFSTFVIEQIVHRGAAKVVLTVRDGEPVPAAIQEIWKSGRFDRLDVQPLGTDESAALLSVTLGGSVDPDAAGRLWTLTRGNILYLRNIVEQEVGDGRLQRKHGCWHWAGDPVIPPGLVELIESRIGALAAPVSDVIDVLAIGEPIGLASLQRMTSPAAVEEADRRGLITLEPAAGGEEVRVAHPMYGEVRRRRAPRTSLRRLRGLVAAELAAAADRDDIRVVVRRAALSLDSDLILDADLLARAAQGAVWLADLPLADRLAAAAVREGAGQESNFLRAHALSWLGRGEEADAVLVAVDAGAFSDVDRARLAFLRASNMLWALGDAARAKVIIDEASGTAEPDARRYVEAFLTVYWFAMDRPDLAISASKDLVLENLPEIVGVEIAGVLAAIHADAGRTAESAATAEAGYAVAARCLDAPQMRFNIADAHVTALLLAGRVGDALDLCDQVREQAADLPGAAHLLGIAIAGRAALGGGRLDTASRWLEQAVAALCASGYAMGWGFRYHLPLTTALAMCACVGEAAAGLAGLATVRRPFRPLDFERSLAAAWVDAGQGAVSEAIAVLLASAERAARTGRFAAEVYCRQIATQFGDRSGAARLRELEAVVEGPRVGLAARLAEALRDGDAAELASLSECFEQMGDLVAAVDAAAHAAIAYRREGMRGSALRCSTRAESLAEQCGGVSTPALRQAADPLPLTAREAEVVMLIAEGLSNRDIADRLTLSVRTVESHTYRAMLKTDTTNRDELAALIRRHTPSAH